MTEKATLSPDLERALPIVSARASTGARSSKRRSGGKAAIVELDEKSGHVEKSLRFGRVHEGHLPGDPHQNVSHGPRWRKALGKVLKSLTHASTGSPSDGLGVEGSESSASVHAFLSGTKTDDDMDYVVDEIVVRGDEGAHQHAVRAGASATHTGTGSDTGLDSSGASIHGSIRREDNAGNDTNIVWRLIRYRAWPLITYFFAPKFEPAEKEDEFVKMIWYQRKSTGFWYALFMVLNWVLYLILNRPHRLFDMIAYYGVLSVFTIPLPFSIALDWPRKMPHTFQIFLMASAFWCAWSEIIEIRECGFFDDGYGNAGFCAGKDFLYERRGSPRTL